MEYEFDFDPNKNRKLKLSRGISFEEVIYLISNDKVLDILVHPNKDKYRNQRLFVIDIDNYAYIVPHTIQVNKIFLKTIFPSRKATKKYLRDNMEDEQ